MGYMKNLYIHLMNSKPTKCPECGNETLRNHEDVYYCTECGHSNMKV